MLNVCVKQVLLHEETENIVIFGSKDQIIKMYIYIPRPSFSGSGAHGSLYILLAKLFTIDLVVYGG